VTEQDILRTELRWGAVVAGVVGLILVVVVASSLALALNPPSHVEPVDPQTLGQNGEFAEANLGTAVGPDGAVTVRVVATQFAFVPRCIPVPAGQRVTIRLASPDVIHGILVTGTNVNTMVVPGYVSEVHVAIERTGDLLMPCHEYCGVGHSEMWATVRVVPQDQWHPDRNGKVSCDAPG
jgi:cytochrome c oxidase subunit 2